ncbi:MAG: SLATT domain-containing protein [Hymenobacter sp.]|nr:MAG: SLATT domain-containing protein [Hymenobacter sp.]
MKETASKLAKIKVDALYGKKKHFNAADRKEKYHYQIGVPLIIINVLTGSVLFYVLTDGTTNWVKYVPLYLALIAALLGGFQTYLNLQQKVEGHRRIGNRYLAVMKKCDRLQAYIADKAILPHDVVSKIEVIATESEAINQDAEVFPTSKGDYTLAQKGISGGEETYTNTELNI